MWQGLWEQYSICLKPLLEGDAELAGREAEAAAARPGRRQAAVLVHGLARRLPPATLWQEIHAYYRLAEMMECAVQAVSDDLAPHAVGVSCYSTYSHALLLALADPVLDDGAADRDRRSLARRSGRARCFRMRSSARPRACRSSSISTAAPGASLVDGSAATAAPSMRFCYPGKLATSVRGRLKRLAQGASPAELALGHDVSVEQSITLLVAPRRALVPDPPAPRPGDDADASSSAAAAWQARTSASAAARSTARIRSVA